MESAERRGLDMSEKYVVDSLGDKCPVPVVKAKKALDKAMPGDVIEVHVDNDIAVQNLRKLASNMQCSSVDRQLEAKWKLQQEKLEAVVKRQGRWLEILVFLRPALQIRFTESSVELEAVRQKNLIWWLSHRIRWEKGIRHWGRF